MTRFLVLFSICLLLISKVYAKLDTLEVTNGMFEARAPIRILVDQHYDYEQTVERIQTEGKVYYHDTGRILRSFSKYWVGVYLQNKANVPIHLNAEAYFDRIWLGDLELPKCGYLPCADPKENVAHPQIHMTYFELPPGTHLFLARIADYHLGPDIAPKLSDSKTFDSKIIARDKTTIYFLIFLASLFALLCILAIILYAIISNKAFLYYSLFCFTLWFHLARTVGERWEMFDFINQQLPWIYIKIPIFLAFFITYTLFVIYLIDAKVKYQNLHKLSFYFAFILPILCLPEFYFLYKNLLPLSYSYYMVVRIMANLFCIYLLFRIWPLRQDRYIMIILIGGGGLMFSEFFTTIFENTSRGFVGFIGMFLELSSFTIGLGYRILDAKRSNYDLKLELKQNETKISELQTLKNEININFLQAQMNPHFMFNALNSIRYHIIANENDKASEYLSKLATLLRSVLHQSTERSISLAKEIETVMLYIEMEALRLSSNFEYELDIENDMETELIMVPPLIIQPFVENAFVHAFANKKDGCKLILKFYEIDEKVIIEVIDNGKGIINNPQTKPIQHQSKALQITKERLMQWGVWYKTQTNLEGKNIKNNKEEIIGYMIKITI